MPWFNLPQGVLVKKESKSHLKGIHLTAKYPAVTKSTSVSKLSNLPENEIRSLK